MNFFRVADNCKVQFWEHENHRGLFDTARNSVAKLKKFYYWDYRNDKRKNWNDKIGSIKCICD